MPVLAQEKYEFAQARIDALLPQITENTPMDDPLMVELMIVTDIVESYEEVHCQIPVPTFSRDAGYSCLMGTC